MSELLSNEQRGTLELFCNKHRRLISKVRKLKRQNLVLSDRRKSHFNNLVLWKNIYVRTVAEYISSGREFKGLRESCIRNELSDYNSTRLLSEKIGSNGLKIRHLRTKIQKLKSDYLRYDKAE